MSDSGVMPVHGCIQNQHASIWEEMTAARRRIAELEKAIRTHRDQHGDDRCWLDDRDLYAAIGAVQPNTALPGKGEFLSNCERFWNCRQNPKDNYETEAERTASLQQRIAELEAELKQARAAAPKLDYGAGRVNIGRPPQ